MSREPLTISHTSLYHALAEAADHFGTEDRFNVAAVRRPGLSGLPGKWELTVTPAPERCGSCGGPDPITCVVCRVVGS